MLGMGTIPVQVMLMFRARNNQGHMRKAMIGSIGIFSVVGIGLVYSAYAVDKFCMQASDKYLAGISDGDLRLLRRQSRSKNIEERAKVVDWLKNKNKALYN